MKLRAYIPAFIIMTFVLLLYVIIVIILNNLSSARLLSAIIILVGAYFFQMRGAIFTAIILIFVNATVSSMPEFNFAELPISFWLNQALLILIAFLSGTYFQQQKKQQENAYAYQALFEQSNDGVFLLDLQGQHIAVNDRAVDMLGYDSKEELTSVRYREIVVPDQLSSADNVLERLLAGENITPHEWVIRQKNGERLTVEVNAQLIKNSHGQAQYIQSIVRDLTQRKDRQEQLRLNEMRFRTIFEHSPISIWEQDFSDIKIYLNSLNIDDHNQYFNDHPEVIIECVRRIKSIEVNDYTLTMFKMPDPTALRHHIFAQLKSNPSSFAFMQHQFAELLQGKTEYELMGSLLQGDGSVINVLLEFKIFPGYEETWERVLAVITDITQLKQAEAELKRSNTVIAEFQSYIERLHYLTIELGKLETLDELYQSAVVAALTDFEFSRAALFIADYEANLLRGTYGTSPEGEVRGEHDYSEPLQSSDWFDKVLENQNRVTLWEDTELLEYGDTIASGWKAAAALWSGNEVLGYIIVDNHLTGRAPRPYEQDLLSLFSTTLGNLIARRRTVMMLEDSQQFLESTFASLKEAVFILEEGTAIIKDCNQAAVNLFGYSRQEFLDTFPNFIDLNEAIPEQNLQCLILALLKVSNLDYYTLRRKDSSTFYGDIQINQLQASTHNAKRGWVMVIHDMTERKSMQQEIINLALEKERVSALQQLITNLRHDIATPLSTIKTSLYILGKTQDEAKQAERLKMIDKQTGVIQTTLESVTEMTLIDGLNIEDLDLTSVNINIMITLIHKDLMEMAASRQQNFHLVLPNDALVVQGDERRLRTAINHITKNAIQYTLEEGSITLSLEEKDDAAMIHIQDTGIGIAPEDQRHIFDRLYRVKQHRPMDGSLGIGLSIAKQIIELHGGSIHVESAINEGSTFTIKLPLTR